MSRVTTVLLWTDWNDEHLIQEVNAALLRVGGRCPDGQPLYALVDLTPGPWGGTKVPTPLYGGAFKDFDLCALATAVQQPWSDRGSVQVLIEDTDSLEPGFQVLNCDDLVVLLTERGQSCG